MDAVQPVRRWLPARKETQDHAIASERADRQLCQGAHGCAADRADDWRFFCCNGARQGSRDALVSRHQGLRYSYAQLHMAARQLASALLSQGLVKGDRVGIWSHNNAEWVLMQLATAQVGLVLVNINPAYRTSEVEYALNKVGCKALVSMPRFKTSDYLGMLRELAPELASCAPGQLQSNACRPCAPWCGLPAQVRRQVPARCSGSGRRTARHAALFAADGAGNQCG
jgi:non-ribosomal peptide synthetase component E (peptide arylation enzyme)